MNKCSYSFEHLTNIIFVCFRFYDSIFILELHLYQVQIKCCFNYYLEQSWRWKTREWWMQLFLTFQVSVFHYILIATCLTKLWKIERIERERERENFRAFLKGPLYSIQTKNQKNKRNRTYKLKIYELVNRVLDICQYVSQ